MHCNDHRVIASFVTLLLQALISLRSLEILYKKLIKKQILTFIRAIHNRTNYSTRTMNDSKTLGVQTVNKSASLIRLQIIEIWSAHKIYGDKNKTATCF